jgi:hypothetical protein
MLDSAKDRSFWIHWDELISISERHRNFYSSCINCKGWRSLDIQYLHFIYFDTLIIISKIYSLHV